ncbi:MAG: polysaccharide deacetylase family protein [Marinilabiliaceae bacterium]
MQICKRAGFFNSRPGLIVKPPALLRAFYPDVLWRVDLKKDDKRVFLTFDDGPVPGVTPWVIDQLKKWDAVAAFFCVGDNVRKYPAVYEQLKNEQNTETGCHGFSHFHGHRKGRQEFLNDLEKALTLMPEVRWFRPPHGSMWPWWTSDVRHRGLNVVMWDVLSKDYDRNLTRGQVVSHVTDNIEPGSVIVFHDSLKAWPNLKVVLPVVMKWLKENGYQTGLLGSLATG